MITVRDARLSDAPRLRAIYDYYVRHTAITFDYETPTLDEFAVELSDMVQGARQGGMTPLLVTPMPVVSSRYFRWITRSLNADAVLRWLGDVEHIYRWQERYAAAVRDVARETHAHLLDLRDAFLRVGPLEKYFCADGIHPNEEGHRLMFECVRSFVTEGWKQARVNASVPA